MIIIIIIFILLIIIRILLLPIRYSLGGNATEPTIFQHFKTKFDRYFFYTGEFVTDRK